MVLCPRLAAVLTTEQCSRVAEGFISRVLVGTTPARGTWVGPLAVPPQPVSKGLFLTVCEQMLCPGKFQVI